MWRMLWTTRTLIMVGMAVIGWYGYWHMEGGVGSDEPLRMKMAEKVTRQISLDLPLPEGRPLVAVSPVAGDYAGILTSHLRSWVARRNTTVVDLDWWESLVPDKLRSPVAPTLGAALARASDRQIPFLIHATVDEWTTDPEDRQCLTMTAHLMDVREETTLATRSVTLPPPDGKGRLANLLSAATSVASVPPAAYKSEDKILKFIVWLASGFLLPWVGSGVITRVVRSDSNLASLSLVVGYLGFMGLSAWYLWGQFGTGLVTWTVVGIVSTIWLGYLEFVCRMLDNRPERL